MLKNIYLIYIIKLYQAAKLNIDNNETRFLNKSAYYSDF